MTDLKGKKIILTGGGGFLGSFVTEQLREHEPADIFIPRSSQYDLRKEEVCRKLMQDVKPDIVVHLAAVVGGIGANRSNPGKFFYDNMAMGIHVIEESRQAGVEKLLVAGTICAYPNMTPVPFREEELWNGYPEVTNAPYGIAKKAMLVQCQGYRQQYGMNAIFLLPVNLYGPRDNFDLETSHVIPALIRKYVEARERREEKIVAWGTGSATREFLHVRDCAAGIVAALLRYDGSEPVNLGSGEEISIRDLTHLIKKMTDFRGRIEWDPSKPDGQPRRCLDTTRAADYFNWRARIPFEEGLRETIQWYEENRNK
ncbi:MAG: GDP-L-fucose synthase [Candidatus Hydrogenedentota bacterium]